jgi:DNA transformation protein
MNEKNKIIGKLINIKNIGPKMAEKLYNAEIYNIDSMQKVGTEDVYLKIDESGGFCGVHNAVYLYAIEGAITDCSWADIPEERKRELKDFTKTLRGSIR